MTDSTQKQTSFAATIQILQLAVLVIGVAGVFLTIGRRDQIIESSQSNIVELRGICADLARVVGSLSISDASTAAQLQAIDARLDNLERR